MEEKINDKYIDSKKPSYEELLDTIFEDLKSKTTLVNQYLFNKERHQLNALKSLLEVSKTEFLNTELAKMQENIEQKFITEVDSIYQIHIELIEMQRDKGIKMLDASIKEYDRGLMSLEQFESCMSLIVKSSEKLSEQLLEQLENLLEHHKIFYNYKL